MSAPRKVLFVSGSVGLGHVGRDMAVANHLRRLSPGTVVHWMAGDPARLCLVDKGELLAPGSEDFDQGTEVLEEGSDDYTTDLLEFTSDLMASFNRNGRMVWETIREGGYDMVIYDEAYEVAIFADRNLGEVERVPVVGLVDFFGTYSDPKDLGERWVRWKRNRQWIRYVKRSAPIPDVYLFFGELEDVPDRRLGLLLPNARRLASRSKLQFVGYPLQFDPREVDRTALRQRYGYGDEKVVLCTIGGTSVGRPLLELCAQAYPLIKGRVPDLRMVMALGPHLKEDGLSLPADIEVLGYEPRLYERMAASDLTVCSGGGTTTLEVTALNRPFIYFPLLDHFEQQKIVAPRCERYQAGVRMDFASATPGSLAEQVIKHISDEGTHKPMRLDGAERAAEIISRLL